MRTESKINSWFLFPFPGGSNFNEINGYIPTQRHEIQSHFLFHLFQHRDTRYRVLSFFFCTSEPKFYWYLFDFIGIFQHGKLVTEAEEFFHI